MKKILFYSITAFILLLAGCSRNLNTKNSIHVENSPHPENVPAENTFITTTASDTEYEITDSMDNLKNAVVGILGENYWPDTLLDSEELAERTGISENMYESYLAEYQNARAGIDMMILIKAKPDEIKTVENYLNDYREVLLRIYERQPQNYAKVYASRIEVIDNYICYIQLGADLSQLVAKGHEEMVSHCQQANESALYILEKRILEK